MHTSAKERRRNPRRKTFQSQEEVTIRLQAGDPSARALLAKVKDVSDTGLGLETGKPLQIGALVYVTGVIVAGLTRKTLDAAPANVTNCESRNGTCYVIGLEFKPLSVRAAMDISAPDYYDALQLSQKADPDTVHRVYRMLAQRYHPDNIESGDSEQFRLLLDAYRVLSDPEKRAAYDATLTQTRQLRWKIFDQPASAQGREGEKRKRAGVLSLLYAKRLNEPQLPAATILDLEDLLGCPREHLEFTLWYLKEAACITRGDNGRYSITAKGVDSVESDRTPELPNDRLLPAGK